jgi:hypothetical protein
MGMTVARIYLEQHITTMKEHIVGKLSELVFSLTRSDLQSGKIENPNT